MTPHRPLLAWLAAHALAGCDTGPRTFTLPFAAKVGDAAFACDASYDGIGTGGATARFVDARLYVHDVTFLDPHGDPLPTELDEDDGQTEGIALLDFEDDSGSCATGSPGTHTAVTGVVTGRVAGLRFKVGVPESHNHLDAATAVAPLDAPGLWWSWAGGFKYARIDLTTDAQPTYFFHLGATSCSGTPGDGFSCAASNVPEIRLDDFELGADGIALDLAPLYAGVDVDAPAEGEDVPGCMAFPGEPECPSMLGAWGLGFEGEPAPGAQRLFSVERP